MENLIKIDKKKLKNYTIFINTNIQNAIERINNNQFKFLIVLDSNKKVLGTITDGDIRRTYLKFNNFTNLPVSNVINLKFVKENYLSSDLKIKNKLIENSIYFLPLVNKNRKLEAIAILSFEKNSIKSNTIIIMAGGKGKRMMPLTKNIPKPLIHYKGTSIIEGIILKAKKQGFVNFIISINYLGEKIRKKIKDGSSLGVKVEYVVEKKPLGTAGSLSLINKKFEDPVIVTNADIISDIDYSSLLDAHITSKSYITAVIKNFSWQNPYGVVEIKKNKINKIIEKPVNKYNVMAGIYSIDKNFKKNLKKNIKLDMNKYIENMIHKKKKISAFSIIEPLIEIGEYTDYIKLTHN